MESVSLCIGVCLCVPLLLWAESKAVSDTWTCGCMLTCSGPMTPEPQGLPYLPYFLGAEAGRSMGQGAPAGGTGSGAGLDPISRGHSWTGRPGWKACGLHCGPACSSETGAGITRISVPWGCHERLSTLAAVFQEDRLQGQCWGLTQASLSPPDPARRPSLG